MYSTQTNPSHTIRYNTKPKLVKGVTITQNKTPMKFNTFVLILLGSVKVSSFNLPFSQQNVVKASSSSTNPLSSFTQEKSLTFALKESTISGDNNVDTTDDSILVTSIAVGGITAAMGFLYGKILGLSLKMVWSTIPSLILKKKGSLNPAYFITAVCTLGGILMGILSSKFHSTFTVADFVSAFSSAPIETLPSSNIHLLPLLLLSLVTSTFGFSVGPEGESFLSVQYEIFTIL